MKFIVCVAAVALNLPSPKVAGASGQIEVLHQVPMGMAGNRELHAEVARPKSLPKAPLPAVIWIHGGGWSMGSHLDNPAAYLAEHGYFTASIEYRLSGEAKWPAQIEDCKLAVRWLRANADKLHVDPDRIGCWGASAGGHLAACLGTMGAQTQFDGGGEYPGVSSAVQAVVDYFGPTDFTHGDAGMNLTGPGHYSPVLAVRERAEFGGTFEQKAPIWKEASPIIYVHPGDPPFLVAHGDQDRMVPIAHSEKLVAALRQAGVPAELIVVKNAGHGFKAPAGSQPVPDAPALRAAVLAFFDRNLKRDSRAADQTIWFAQPASFYTESCPLGNGHLGAMLFGGVAEERLVLNETGMWSGSPYASDRPGAVESLPEIRRLLFAGQGLEAQKLIQEKFTSVRPRLVRVSNEPGRAPGAGSVTPFGCYQTLGNLWLKLETPSGPVREYRRELDLSRAIARVSYRVGDTTFTREAWVSGPADVIVLRLTADRPGQISCSVRLDRPERSRTKAAAPDQLLMTGELDNGFGGHGVRYAARLKAVTEGGGIVAADGTLKIDRADTVTLLVTAITDIKTYAGSRSDDPAAATAKSLARISREKYEVLREAHVKDYSRYYRRTSLSLGSEDSPAAQLPTPERLQAYHRNTPDPALAALYFNFGRYLLISSSRPGGLPPNLVGLWAEEIQTPWNGDWHLDVNLEMNYWAVDVTGLSDLFQPYFDFISSLQEPGARTARTYFGARGWTSFAIGNPWGFTSPLWNGGVGVYPSGAWLCQGLWDHYVYTQDLADLRRAYPILRGAARFFADALAEEPTHHWLVTAPSNSPENPYIQPNGDRVSNCAGPTIDEQQIRELFGACIAAGRLLGLDPDFQRELAAKRARLAPTRIGSDGRIMEWLEEYKEGDPHHRHVSPLWGLYPGTEITPKFTPDLAAAARKLLETRGDSGMGWTLAYKIALWARLGDGNHAFRLLKAQLAPIEARVYSTKGPGGTYPNLFDACPPFEIDANLGGPAAIAEMLLQSNEGDLNLLPALPDAWPEGTVRGLRARGAWSVDLEWRNRQLVAATIHGAAGRSCVVRYRDKTATLEIPASGIIQLDGALQP